jgi:hypothetical protein
MILAYLLAVLLAVGIAASGSRTGMLQWLLVAGLAFWWCRKSRRHLMELSFLALAIYFAFAIALPSMLLSVTGVVSGGLVERLTEETGCSNRRTLWSNVFHLIAQKPWLGWGWGELDYAHFITLYPGDRFCEILDNAHNLPLHLAVELGVPIAVLFCSTCGWLIWRNKPWAETDPTRQMAWGVLAVIGLHSLVEYPLWYGPFQLAVLLCVRLLWVAPAIGAGPLQNSGQRRHTTAVVSIILIAACAVAAWDYWRVSQLYLTPSARHTMYRENTLEKVRRTWFFRDQVKFAELTTTELTADNAVAINALALEMLHFSPEPRVIEKVTESAVMLGQDAEALYYLQRYKAAFPAQYARWRQPLKPGE